MTVFGMYGRDAVENIENISYYTKGWENAHRTISTSCGRARVQFAGIYSVCTGTFLTPGILMLWDF